MDDGLTLLLFSVCGGAGSVNVKEGTVKGQQHEAEIVAVSNREPLKGIPESKWRPLVRILSTLQSSRRSAEGTSTSTSHGDIIQQAPFQASIEGQQAKEEGTIGHPQEATCQVAGDTFNGATEETKDASPSLDTQASYHLIQICLCRYHMAFSSSLPMT